MQDGKASCLCYCQSLSVAWSDTRAYYFMLPFSVHYESFCFIQLAMGLSERKYLKDKL